MKIHKNAWTHKKKKTFFFFLVLLFLNRYHLPTRPITVVSPRKIIRNEIIRNEIILIQIIPGRINKRGQREWKKSNTTASDRAELARWIKTFEVLTETPFNGIFFPYRHTRCESGGIGRHARFRFWCREVWGFESPLSHSFPPPMMPPAALRGPLRGERQGAAPPGPPICTARLAFLRSHLPSNYLVVNSAKNQFECKQQHRNTIKATHIGGPGRASPWCSPHRGPRRAAGGRRFL